jgi:hypothetical protein
MDDVEKNISILKDAFADSNLDKFLKTVTANVYLVLKDLLAEIKFVFEFQPTLAYKESLYDLTVTDHQRVTLSNDIQYLETMKEMDEEIQRKIELGEKSEPSSSHPKMEHIVPVGGLLMTRFHILLCEHTTALQFWNKKLSGNKEVKANVNSESPMGIFSSSSSQLSSHSLSSTAVSEHTTITTTPSLPHPSPSPQPSSLPPSSSPPIQPKGFLNSEMRFDLGDTLTDSEERRRQSDVTFDVSGEYQYGDAGEDESEGNVAYQEVISEVRSLPMLSPECVTVALSRSRTLSVQRGLRRYNDPQMKTLSSSSKMTLLPIPPGLCYTPQTFPAGLPPQLSLSSSSSFPSSFPSPSSCQSSPVRNDSMTLC